MNGSSLKSKAVRLYALSQLRRVAAKNDDFPVLFSPISSVSGATGSQPGLEKHLMFSMKIAFTR
jgi:hypothetical protein